MPLRIITILVLGSCCAAAGTLLLKLGATGRREVLSFINPKIIHWIWTVWPGRRVLYLRHVTAKSDQCLSVHNSELYDRLPGRDLGTRVSVPLVSASLALL